MNFLDPTALRAWNARQKAARDAYDADMAVREGGCERCGGDRRNVTGRVCDHCYYLARKAAS